MALLVAVLGTQYFVTSEIISFDDHRFMGDFPVVQIVLGGLAFGAGMVLTRGCVGRLTVLGATGNLRAVTALLIFAVVAHATLKGVLSPLRTAAGDIGPTLDAVSLSDSFGNIPSPCHYRRNYSGHYLAQRFQHPKPAGWCRHWWVGDRRMGRNRIHPI